MPPRKQRTLPGQAKSVAAISGPASKKGRPLRSKLLDRRGQPYAERVLRLLKRLEVRLRREFPQLPEVTIAKILQTAAPRLAAIEQGKSSLTKRQADARLTVRKIAASELRRASATLDSGRNVQLRKVLAKLSRQERLVCIWKAAGFSSDEIAIYQGCSAASVDILFARAKQKLRRLLRTK